MAQTFTKVGYGQVEPNHLSAQRTGQIYAQLPAASEIAVLENGMFAKYDAANEEVNFDGLGEWMLVFNEVKLYEGRQFNKDFALKAADHHNGVMVPRLFKTQEGDTFTTNMVKNGDYSVGDLLVVGSTGVLEADATPAAGEMVWQIVKIYTLADGNPAVKITRLPNATEVAGS